MRLGNGGISDSPAKYLGLATGSYLGGDIGLSGIYSVESGLRRYTIPYIHTVAMLLLVCVVTAWRKETSRAKRCLYPYLAATAATDSTDRGSSGIDCNLGPCDGLAGSQSNLVPHAGVTMARLNHHRFKLLRTISASSKENGELDILVNSKHSGYSHLLGQGIAHLLFAIRHIFGSGSLRLVEVAPFKRGRGVASGYMGV